MARLLIVLALLLFVVVLSTRALRRGRLPPRGRSSGATRRFSGAPERLVCGACGAAFDPEQSGWICPKCGK